MTRIQLARAADVVSVTTLSGSGDWKTLAAGRYISPTSAISTAWGLPASAAGVLDIWQATATGIAQFLAGDGALTEYRARKISTGWQVWRTNT